MNNAAEIKDRINLRDFVQHDLGKPHTSSTNYDIYKCPLHHETKGYSLAVYPDHWTCYGKCNASGDVFEWLKRYQGFSFREAVAYLGGDTINRAPIHPPTPRAAAVDEPPNEGWQFNAGLVVDACYKVLWREQGAPAMRYLRGRGLLES